MIRTREAEERISKLYSEKEMRCPTHLCIGQEAVSAGVTAALDLNDLVFRAIAVTGITSLKVVI